MAIIRGDDYTGNIELTLSQDEYQALSTLVQNLDLDQSDPIEALRYRFYRWDADGSGSDEEDDARGLS